MNLNALTQIDTVFSITNQGTQNVEVWITTNGTNADTVTFFNGTHTEGSRAAIDEQSNAHTLTTGQAVEISMEIDTRGLALGANDELIDGLTIHANATA